MELDEFRVCSCEFVDRVADVADRTIHEATSFVFVRVISWIVFLTRRKERSTITVLKDYWFDWQTYNPKTLVYTLGEK